MICEQNMEHYLIPDIVHHIIKYLDKRSAFNLVNSSRFLQLSRREFYNNFVFNYNEAKELDDTMKKYIISLENIEKFQQIKEFSNVKCIYNTFDLDMESIFMEDLTTARSFEKIYFLDIVLHSEFWYPSIDISGYIDCNLTRFNKITAK